MNEYEKIGKALETILSMIKDDNPPKHVSCCSFNCRGVDSDGKYLFDGEKEIPVIAVNNSDGSVIKCPLKKYIEEEYKRYCYHPNNKSLEKGYCCYLSS